MEELWKIVDNSNVQYEVSSLGKVRKKHKNEGEYIEVKPYVDRNGYLRVSFGKKTCAVHRLVAQAFIPNPHNYPVVHHIDETKSNNTVTNLLWCSHKQNRIFGVPAGSGKNAKRNYTVLQLDINTEKVIAEFNTFKEAARSVGIKDSSVIGKCAQGKGGYKTAYGYKWRVRYKDNEINEKMLVELSRKAFTLAPEETIYALRNIVLLMQGHL